MVPLRITALLASDLGNPSRPPAIDALLAFAVCLSEGREPPPADAPTPHVEIPLARSTCGRVWLASFGQSTVEQVLHGRFTNRRFPLAEAQAMAEKRFTRIGLTGGPTKSFRIPIETGWLCDDTVTWYAIGDEAAVRALLVWIGYLGKRRGVGLGRVQRWTVEPFDPAAEGWDEGFPAVRDGRPLRNLPLDWSGVCDDAPHGYATLAPPYWEREREELCLTP